jgi:hypothetical protein
MGAGLETELLLAALIPAILGWWALIFFCVAHASGWRRLAKGYRRSAPVTGTSWRWQSAQLRWSCNYSGCLLVTVNEEGLRLVPMLPFRIAHPPLFIPWADLSIQQRQTTLGFETVTFAVAQEPAIPLRLGGRLVKKIEGALGQLAVKDAENSTGATV